MPAIRRTWLRLAVASAAMALVLFGAASYWWRRQPGYALMVLSGEYGAFRPFELRVWGAAHAPVRGERGSGRPAVESSAPYLEVRAAASRQLKANREDPAWLWVQGRADVLSGHEHDAIRTFQAAADLGADSPEFWTDFGTAYYQLGERNSSFHEYATAVEMFGRASARSPDPAVLFNLGSALAKLQLFDAAREALQRCLEVEKDSAWLGETRARLREVEQRRARLFAHGAGAEAVSGDEERMERAFSEDIARAWSGDAALFGQLKGLAAELKQKHGDAWLVDVLAVSEKRRNMGEIGLLSQLARIRTAGRFDQYDALSPGLARLRQTPQPAPIAAWRDLELLFRASHDRNLLGCPAVDDWIAWLDRRAYRAIEIQAMLERSTCESGQNQLDAAYASAWQAIRLAEAADFGSILIRAKGFVASDYVNQGRYGEAYRISSETLDEAIRGGYPVRRTHQFYNTIMRAADRLEQWYTARAAAGMARRVADAFGSAVYAMIAQTKRADFSLRLGRYADAGNEYAEAMRLYGQLATGPNVAAYAATAQSGVFESHQDYAGLLALRQSLLGAGNPFLEAPVDIALARVALRQKRPEQAREHAGHLTAWLGRQNAPSPEADRYVYRKMLERASGLETRALLELNDTAGAYRAWQEYLRSEARLMGGRVRAEGAPLALDGDTAAITLADLESGIAIWIQHGQGLDFCWASADRQTVLREVRKLRRLCADPSSPVAAIRRIELSLWHDLFQRPLDAARGCRKMSIRAGGELGSLPVQLLFTDFAPELLRAGIAFVPFDVSARIPPGRRSILVAGSRIHADFSANLPPLPDLDAEVRRIAGVAPEFEILSGDSATAAAVERAMGEARVFHFAGHAVYWRDGIALVVVPDAADPRADGRLGILRITPATQLPAELAVFSACSTADLEENATVLPTRLAESALLAGAHHVVGTLWDVDSSATGRFDAALYGFLQQGKSVPEAVSAAVGSIRTLGEFQHPYFWASFALFQTAD
jgi:tetratricopeptide (TPR) repeat protein